MSRSSVRTVVSLLGATSLAVSALLVPSTPALAAAGTAVGTLAIAPGEQKPGRDVDATVTIDTQACDVTAGTVKVSGTYVNVDGDHATTDVVTADGSGSTYTATLTIPADAARSDLTDEPITYEASAVCAAPAESPSPTPAPALKRASALTAVPAGATSAGTATVTVLALSGAPTVTVDPDTVKQGDAFDFSITGCTGGLADLFFLDGDGNDLDVPDAAVDQLTATSYEGTYTVPKTAVLGDGGLVVDCVQAASTGAGVRIIDDSATTGSGSGAPIAIPVASAPQFTG